MKILLISAVIALCIAAVTASSRRRALEALVASGVLLSVIYLSGGAADLALFQLLGTFMLLVIVSVVLSRTEGMKTLSPTDVFSTAVIFLITGLASVTFLKIIGLMPPNISLGASAQSHSGSLNELLLAARPLDLAAAASIIIVLALGTHILLREEAGR